LKSIKAKKRAVEQSAKPVDIDRWRAVFQSKEALVVEFYCVDCFTYDTLELVLKSPTATLVANEENPGFTDLLDLCAAEWPRFWDDYTALATKAFDARQFVYVRSQGAEGFEYVVYEP
jgi:hypothetical protein